MAKTGSCTQKIRRVFVEKSALWAVLGNKIFCGPVFGFFVHLHGELDYPSSPCLLLEELEEVIHLAADQVKVQQIGKATSTRPTIVATGDSPWSPRLGDRPRPLVKT
ncbi:hypothetical protein FFLO_02603 [Filobasidium floriforme]|uniref:Uncharacterized protein n=1 Tax=Filobasidium floriforme TaxID=5210 RepID=A0A8K0NP00_9TREE|nr:uncharacterized protein HD553DRAFT_322939 [Filobasidium floriforme]KAG7561963.1 hypothetical protein FFLO_02603 [Filobasidium floriforme]KAH8087463.1 hypothetical protein HD553DRAFT_322939 [Filobasidium floriforme]